MQLYSLTGLEIPKHPTLPNEVLLLSLGLEEIFL